LEKKSKYIIIVGKHFPGTFASPPKRRGDGSYFLQIVYLFYLLVEFQGKKGYKYKKGSVRPPGMTEGEGK
jgi:hypothetical protein